MHYAKYYVSIPYWLGSKLRDSGPKDQEEREMLFQSPIGWGLSCEFIRAPKTTPPPGPFQSPIGWGLSCEDQEEREMLWAAVSFNPLLVGV